MLIPGATVEAAIMAVILNCAAGLGAGMIAIFSLRRTRRSRSRRRTLYALMTGFAGLVLLANLLALAAPLGFWRLVAAYGAVAALVLWAMMRTMMQSRIETR